MRYEDPSRMSYSEIQEYKNRDKREFKRRELEFELRHESGSVKRKKRKNKT